jgi:branched-chain amino acid transport system permease protein
VVTLSAVIAVEDLIVRNPPLMNEKSISTNPMPQPEWFGQYVGAQNPVTFRTDYWKFTTFVIIALLLVGMAVANLRRGATGRRFLAVRSNERAAASSGINVARTKMLGFGISSAIAGLAGVALAYKLPAVGADNFSVFAGLALLAFVYLGGITTTWGALIGGGLMAGGLIPEFLGIHFVSIDTAYINCVGAIGLIINAIATGGSGIALLQRDQGAHVLAGLRRPRQASPAADSGGAPVATNVAEVPA